MWTRNNLNLITMCKECYTEYGSPTIVSDKTKRCAELIRAIYDSPDGIVGGYAHIATDDWNLEDDNIQSCLLDAEKGTYDYIGEETRQACIECLRFMLTLTEEERYSAMAIREGILEVNQL